LPVTTADRRDVHNARIARLLRPYRQPDRRRNRTYGLNQSPAFSSLRQLAGWLSSEITVPGQVTAELMAGHDAYHAVQHLPGIGPVPVVATLNIAVMDILSDSEHAVTGQMLAVWGACDDWLRLPEWRRQRRGSYRAFRPGAGRPSGALRRGQKPAGFSTGPVP
jgi:hypothetical protein